MTEDNVRDKIAKLLKLAQANDSIEEAAVAFAKAQELATRHALDLGDVIDSDTAEANVEPMEVEDIEKWQVEEWNKAIPWKLDIATTCAHANGCRTYYSGGWHGGIWMYGQGRDLATARHMYDLIVRQVEHLSKLAVKAYRDRLEVDYESVKDGVECGEDTPRTYGRDFRMGAEHEISKRIRSQSAVLTEERKRVEAARQHAIVGGDDVAPHDLADATKALARIERADDYLARLEADIDEFRKGLNLHAGGGFTGASGGSGYGHGREAGRGVNLGGRKALR